jgi:hypothetical protein
MKYQNTRGGRIVLQSVEVVAPLILDFRWSSPGSQIQGRGGRKIVIITGGKEKDKHVRYKEKDLILDQRGK